MGLWHLKGTFPIRFEEIESLKEHDETEHFLQSLEKLTPIIGEIFSDKAVEKSPRAL